MVRDGLSITLPILEQILLDAEPLMQHAEGQPVPHTVRPLLEKYGESCVSLLR